MNVSNVVVVRAACPIAAYLLAACLLAACLLGGCGCRGQRACSVISPAQQALPLEVPPLDLGGAADAGSSWSFSNGAAGTLPEGFRRVEGHWGVATVSEARGLLQKAESPSPVFNLVLIDATSYEDVEISVDVRPLGGRVDQGGGPVWRAQDGQNYYIARWNPLEDNYRVYKVVNGVRIQLASAQTRPGSNSRRLAIRMTGSTIECSLDGEALLRVEDDQFPSAGKIGLWAKADARTLFSDLRAAGL